MYYIKRTYLLLEALAIQHGIQYPARYFGIEAADDVLHVVDQVAVRRTGLLFVAPDELSEGLYVSAPGEVQLRRELRQAPSEHVQTVAVARLGLDTITLWADIHSIQFHVTSVVVVRFEQRHGLVEYVHPDFEGVQEHFHCLHRFTYLLSKFLRHFSERLYIRNRSSETPLVIIRIVPQIRIHRPVVHEREDVPEEVENCIF